MKDDWKEEEKLFLFEYHAKPLFETDFKGSFVNCWVMDSEFNSAKNQKSKFTRRRKLGD